MCERSVPVVAYSECLERPTGRLVPMSTSSGSERERFVEEGLGLWSEGAVMKLFVSSSS